MHSLEKMLKAASKMVRFYPRVRAAEGPSFTPVPADLALINSNKAPQITRMDQTELVFILFVCFCWT